MPALRRASLFVFGPSIALLAVACASATSPRDHQSGGSTPPRTASDSFNRADGPLGPDWGGTPARLSIQGGEVGLTGLAGSGFARWVGDTFGPDQFSEVTVGSLEGQSFASFRGLQVYVREQTQGTPWRYGFHYFSNIRKYQIKYDGGPTPDVKILAESAVLPYPGPGDVFRVEAVGDTIRGYVNGRLMLSVIDDALGGGDVGFVIGLNLDATQAPHKVVASWRGGEL